MFRNNRIVLRKRIFRIKVDKWIFQWLYKETQKINYWLSAEVFFVKKRTILVSEKFRYRTMVFDM